MSSVPIMNRAGTYRDITQKPGEDVVIVGNIDTDSYPWKYPVHIPGFLDENFTVSSETVSLLITTGCWEKVEEGN